MKENIIKYLTEKGLYENYLEVDSTSETVELAAKAIGCEPGRIAKTLSLHCGDRVILVVAMGTARVDNKKFKEQFHAKPRFLSFDEVEPCTGHPVGGVCPFLPKEGVQVYLDESLKAFDPVYPAAGAKNNAVRITLSKLQELTAGEWVDVCI